MRKDRDFLLYRYELNSAYAYGFNDQQMLDRDRGLIAEAIYSQEQAAKFARIAGEYRDEIAELDRITATYWS